MSPSLGSPAAASPSQARVPPCPFSRGQRCLTPSVKDTLGRKRLALHMWAKRPWGHAGVYSGVRTPPPEGQLPGHWGSPRPSPAPDAIRVLSLWVSQVLGLLETPPSGFSSLRARPSPSSVRRDTQGHASGKEERKPPPTSVVCALDDIDLGASVMSTTFSLEQASHPHLCPPRGPQADCGWWKGLSRKSSGRGESYLASDLHSF